MPPENNGTEIELTPNAGTATPPPEATSMPPFDPTKLAPAARKLVAVAGADKPEEPAPGPPRQVSTTQVIELLQRVVNLAATNPGVGQQILAEIRAVLPELAPRTGIPIGAKMGRPGAGQVFAGIVPQK